jgi:TP901 family phage tail tape measure protein
MPDFETLIVRIVGDSSSFEKSMAKSSAAASSLGTKMKSVGKGMSTYVSLPLAAAGAASVKMAADFETSLQQAVSVTGKTGKAAAEARNQMNDLALQLGRDTAFSAKEAADAMYDLASSGWNTKQMAQGLPGIMSLASATQSDLAQTTGVVTSTLAQFGLKASDSGHVADVMTKSISATRLTMDDLRLGMKYVGPVAKGLGMSLEETTAAMGALADNGIKGEQAGTALRGILGSLAAPSSTAAGAINNLGLSVEDVNPKTHSLAQIVQTLSDAGMTASDAYKIFGREGASAILALQKTGAPALNKLTKDLENSGGMAEKVAKQQMNTLAGQFEQLKGSAETLAITFGQVLIPILTSVARALIPVVNAFANLPGPIRTAIVVLAGLAAAAGPTIWAAGAIITAWRTVGPVIVGAATRAAAAMVALGNSSVVMAAKARASAIAMAVATKAMRAAAIAARVLRVAFFLMLGPWGILIAAIIAGAYLIYKHWDKIKAAAQALGKAVVAVWRNIKAWVVNAAQGIAKSVSDRFETMNKNVIQSGENMRKGIADRFRSMDQNSRNTSEAMRKAVADRFQTMDQNARQASDSMRKGVSDFVDRMRGNVTTLIDSMRKGGTDRFETLRKNAVAASDSMRRSVGDHVNRMASWVGNTIDDLRGRVAGLWDKMIGGARSFGEGFGKTLRSGVGNAVDSAREWLGNLALALAGLLDKLGVGPADELRKAGNNLKADMFARGGVFAADRGGVAGPGRIGIVGEAGHNEAIVNLEKRTPESERAFQMAANSPNARKYRDEGGMVSGRGEGLGATHHNIDPSIKERVNAIARATGTSWNTYAGHGKPGGSTEDFTADFWGKGGRGASLSASQGKKAAELAINKYNANPATLYVIAQGRYWRGGNWKPWPQDPHRDHTHVSWDSPRGWGNASGGSMIDVAGEFAKFAAALAPFPDTGILDLFSGLGSTVVDWTKEAVWEWAKSIMSIGGSAPSPSGDHMQWHEEGLRYSGAFPVTPTNLSKLHNLAMKESGDNPKAKNPSGASGLMQMMPPTFDAHKVNAGDDIMNPIHNTAASARYQKAQYGGLTTQSPYRNGGVIPGVPGQRVLLQAESGERVLPIDVTKAFDKLSTSIMEWSRDGRTGPRDRDRFASEKVERILERVEEKLERQLSRMSTKEELAEVSIRANAAFSMSKGAGQILDRRLDSALERVEQLIGG